MRLFAILALTSLAAALPQPMSCRDVVPRNAPGGDDPANVALARRCNEELLGSAKRQSIVEQLQSSFNRDNPNGTPTEAGDPDDLNGDGVINFFEAGAQAS